MRSAAGKVVGCVMLLSAVTACATSEPAVPYIQVLPPSLTRSNFEEIAQEPARTPGKYATSTWRNAAKVFRWEPDKLFPVRVACCGDLTLIYLGAGEVHVGKEAIAGQKVIEGADKPWLIGSTIAGNNEVYAIGALAPGQKTKMFIGTNKRSYPFLLTSVAANKDDGMVKFDIPDERPKQRYAQPIDPTTVDSRYSIELTDGPQPSWMPVAAFNIGTQKTWIQFADRPGVVGAPLVRIGAGKPRRAVNVRTEDSFYEIDALFAEAELNLGESTVIIRREANGGF